MRRCNPSRRFAALPLCRRTERLAARRSTVNYLSRPDEPLKRLRREKSIDGMLVESHRVLGRAGMPPHDGASSAFIVARRLVVHIDAIVWPKLRPGRPPDEPEADRSRRPSLRRLVAFDLVAVDRVQMRNPRGKIVGLCHSIFEAKL